MLERQLITQRRVAYVCDDPDQILVGAFSKNHFTDFFFGLRHHARGPLVISLRSAACGNALSERPPTHKIRSVAPVGFRFFPDQPFRGRLGIGLGPCLEHVGGHLHQFAASLCLQCIQPIQKGSEIEIRGIDFNRFAPRIVLGTEAGVEQQHLVGSDTRFVPCFPNLGDDQRVLELAVIPTRVRRFEGRSDGLRPRWIVVGDVFQQLHQQIALGFVVGHLPQPREQRGAVFVPPSLQRIPEETRVLALKALRARVIAQARDKLREVGGRQLGQPLGSCLVIIRRWNGPQQRFGRLMRGAFRLREIVSVDRFGFCGALRARGLHAIGGRAIAVARKKIAGDKTCG